MRYVGRVTNWDDEKGYGFVTPNGGGERAFVHVKAFENRGRRPVEGDLISYEPIKDQRQRLNAARVRHVVVARTTATRRNGRWFPRRSLGVIVLLAMAIATYGGKIPLVVTLAYIGMSLIAFFAYGLDKSAARTDRQRTPESTLHALELLCGWPGALIAQGTFRHKTRKLSFQIAFWLVVALNVGALAWLIQSGRLNMLA
ncbi:DUF1294 domain-containing protein [Dokdonella sp.]|uniref:DUF1294 domain-containing protein n=1 Tax=Dokdonella sp. TaxID=2291710 RepID=UPI003527F7D9